MNDSAYHNFRCVGVSYGRAMNAFSGEIDSGAYRGSTAGFAGMTGSIGAGVASALTASVPAAATSSAFTFGSGADGNGMREGRIFCVDC